MIDFGRSDGGVFASAGLVAGKRHRAHRYKPPAAIGPAFWPGRRARGDIQDARSARRRIFPVGPFGSSDRKWIDAGTL